MEISEKQSNHDSQLEKIISTNWGSTQIVSRGKIFDALKLPGLIITENDSILGYILYFLKNTECEIILLDIQKPGKGFGTELLNNVISIAKINLCSSVIVVTTNDNTYAIYFYQKNGFHIESININIKDEYRKIKKEIPKYGIGKIEIRDEIVLRKII